MTARPTLYTYSNNGILAVIDQAGKAKLDQVRNYVQEQRQESHGLGGDRVAYERGYELVGRIPTATFCSDEAYEAVPEFRQWLTGPMSLFERLAAGFEVQGTFITVPFSNGFEIADPTDRLTAAELIEMFGLVPNPRRTLVYA